MFSKEQIEKIAGRLTQGITADAIAKELGLPLTTLRARLANSGYRIEITRSLVPIVPVGMSTIAAATL